MSQTLPSAEPRPAPSEPDRVGLAHAAAGLGMWDWDVERDDLHWDAGARALHGVGPDAPLSQALLISRIHPGDRERVAEAIRVSLDPDLRGPCEVSYRVLDADGTERWIQAMGRVAWTDAVGTPARAVRVLGIVRDDTLARAAERTLAERDERLRAALYASRTGTFRWDIRTNALDWDENLDRLFGLVPGVTVRSLEGFIAAVHPHDRPRVIDACARCAADGADFDEEFRVVWPDGSEHWLDDKGRTFRGGDGAPAYMTGACVDVTERKRAEAERERLLDAERAAATLAQQRLAELEAFYAGAPVGLALLDRDIRFVRVNAQLARLHARAPEAHVGRTPAEVVPFPTGELDAALRRVLETGETVGPFPVRQTLPGEAEARAWLVTYYPVADVAGGVAGVGAVIDEITELERATGALRESEGRLRRILESGIVGAFFWHVDGAITGANDAFLDILGYTRGDLETGRIDWRRLTPQRWKGEDERKVAELLATGRHGPYEKEYLAADGTPVPVMIASAFFEGSRTEGVALCVDHTAQRRAEDALRDALGETECARAAAVKTAGHLDRQHAVTAALSAALREDEIAAALIEHAVPLLGADAAAVLRFDGETLINEGYVGYREESMRGWTAYPAARGTPGGDVARTGEPVFLENRGDWEAGYPQWTAWVESHGYVAYAGLPLRAGGRVTGVLVLNFRDERRFTTQDRETLLGMAAIAAQAFERARLYREAVDARREAEEARREAETANQAKSAFLASMSHELRTPLNAIAGYVDLIQMGIRGPVTDAQADDLGRIQRSTHHLLGLINEVLSFARIDAGTLHYEIGELAVAPLLADAEAMVAPQSAARGLRLRSQPCDSALRVRADADKVRQIVLNLLGNAIKFTASGGSVELSAGADAAAVRIRVRDTGIGIPLAEQAAVFEPFVQLDRRFPGAAEGVGLGLAISRELARAMGGDLSVDSAPGEGSTFTLTLPAV